MKSERRCKSRERPVGLSYIQFELGGGGIVVNASEQGLAFHAAAALRQTGPIQLCVSPNPVQQIKLSAEIAWMDETKKSGGLRFTELTTDATNQILQWLTQTSESSALARKFVVPSCALVKETGSRLPPTNGARDLLSSAPDNAMPTGSASPTLFAPQALSIQATAILPVPFSKENHNSISRPRLLYGVVTGLLIVVLVLLPILLLQDFRREIGNSVLRIGEKLKGYRDSQRVTSSSIPIQLSNPNSGNPAPIPKPISETHAKETLEQTDSTASTQTTQGTVNSTDFRYANSQNSRQHSADAHSRRGRSALARQLWTAVGAGDSSAEVALARLYLTGDGVPKNCEQARVLMRAALKSGHFEALQQSRRLNGGTCR